MGIGRSLGSIAESLSIAGDKTKWTWSRWPRRSVKDEILDSLERPRWNRLFHIYDAFKLGIGFNTIQKLTKIDPWFLRQIEDLIQLEKEIEKYTVENIPRDLLMEAKKKVMPTGKLHIYFVVLKVRFSKNVEN